MEEQQTRQRHFCGARRAATVSLILGLLSVALNMYPVGLVFPLQRWLGEFLPLFLPLSFGAAASGLAVLALARSPQLSWLAVGGLVLGVIGLVLGSLLAVITAYMLLRTGGD
jgi:hypothetical protein